MNKMCLVGAGLLALASSAWAGATAPRFTAQRIEAIGGAESLGLAINNHGVVVGQFVRANGSIGAYRWTSAGGMVELAGLSATSETLAMNLNDAGQVVGYGYRTDGQTEALLWQANGQVVNVGQIWDPTGGTEVFDINESGQMVGSRRLGPAQRQGLVYSLGGEIVDVGTIEGNNQSKNTAINEAGDVVGFSYRLFSPDRAALTRREGDSYGETIDLGPLGRTFSRAFDINDLGQVVGLANDGASAPRAALFDTERPGDWVNLGILEGSQYEESDALSINNNGWIVGRSFGFSEPANAATLYLDGRALELALLVDNLAEVGFVELLEATSINDLNQIVGTGLMKDGTLSGFVLTVVPAPGGAAVLALAGVLTARRRR